MRIVKGFRMIGIGPYPILFCGFARMTSYKFMSFISLNNVSSTKLKR